MHYALCPYTIYTFSTKMLRFRGEMQDVKETINPQAIVRDNGPYNSMPALLANYPREHFIDLTPSFRVMETLEKGTAYKVKLQSVHGAPQIECLGRHLQLTFGVDDLICMIEEWVGNRCTRIVDKLRKERREEAGAETGEGGGEGKGTDGEEEAIEQRAEEEEQDKGLLDSEFYAILGQLNLSRMCEQVTTSLLLAPPTKKKSPSSHSAGTPAGTSAGTSAGASTGGSLPMQLLSGALCRLRCCKRRAGQGRAAEDPSGPTNKVTPYTSVPYEPSSAVGGGAADFEIRAVKQKPSAEKLEGTLMYGESNCLGLVNRMLEIHVSEAVCVSIMLYTVCWRYT
jgi:hypothetical protein